MQLNYIASFQRNDSYMHVLFDYQAFEMQEFGGVSRSYAELIACLPKENVQCEVGLKESDNVYIKLDGLRPLHYTHDRYFRRKKLFPGQRTLIRLYVQALGHGNCGLAINQEYCIRLLKQQQFDIFEPTFFTPYFLPYLKGKPFVLTVHDMIPELFPQYFSRDDFQITNKKLLCPLAAAIHVPSLQTKKDLIDILHIAPEKITVINHGSSKIARNETDPQRPIDKPYILYVGGRNGYKNFTLLLQELVTIIYSVPDIVLLCTGLPFEESEQRLIADLGLLDHVQHCFATEDDFYALYHCAVAFVYPSAYEGFGLPILEAFQCGCPVMLNNASCFPEIAGDAALYFDINRKGDFAEHFIEFYKSAQEDRQALIARGFRRLKMYSWNVAAKKLSNIYITLI